ncbi:alpha/beta-Hydrolases superfamily protein [Rhynchospora pubera]|uniref:soluble epoxide hydrolase n=1 Tax=Rhynchospora pubera TaxID=906938 RepID=A0AAV8ENQ3_9POAL|nr:alpha/beta-Hydrolases superfamily protein [Rhynchospora pubera]
MANKEKFMEVRHCQVATNGIMMHVAEQGDLSATPVLLLHGFPELWLSWRQQMDALAANGYRAIAPDLRGYGDTDVPDDPTAYTIFHIVGDLIGLLDQLELSRVFVVGHDWGATVAWHLCLFRPDRVKALVNMGVPFFERHPSVKPTDQFKVFGEGFYVTQFQEAGRAETSFAKYDVLTVLKKYYSIKIDNLTAPPGMEIMDFLEAPTSHPEWFSEDELQYFSEKFQKNGFTGPFNYYRNMDMNWALIAPWQGAKIEVPTKFIIGERDTGFISFGTGTYIKSGGLKAIVPKLEVVAIDGHHFIHREKAEEVTSEILSYFSSLN